MFIGDEQPDELTDEERIARRAVHQLLRGRRVEVGVSTVTDVLAHVLGGETPQ